ncbi:hypothetical protein [Marispirochaeta sp.]|uniref:hypothetical protein n=1 Tax=Marispirochaeta sp. TaxID=2038653 RepID=UPI0029C6AA95|nr:hypothetical protein [Marispirochaeta sp.]
MKMRRAATALSSIVLVLIWVLSFSGCGESGLMDIYAVSNAIRLSTIPAGSVLEPGDQIPVSLASDSDSTLPDLLLVSVHKGSGALISTREYDVKASVVLLETTDLVPGYYIVSVRSRNEDSDEAELELPFFISSSAGNIKGISAYPSTVLPGEGMVFFADLEQGAVEDPYIRWKAGGRTIAAGRVADGFQLASWQVPGTPGIYLVTAEYFPFPPPQNGNFSFSGAEKRGEAFVSTDQGTPRGELGPWESYSSLFHFRGTFQSSGSTELPEPRIEGNPLLALDAEIFGYRFSAEEALVFDTSLIPFKNGKPEAFVLEMKGIFSKSGAVFTVRDQQDNQVISLERNDDGFLLKGNDFYAPMPLLRTEADVPLYLACVLEPHASLQRLRWYADGEYQGEVSLPPITGFLGSSFSTIIGGGFSGLLDEFGIRSVESPSEGGIYGFAMRERYGRSLAMAEGFDTPVPDGIIVNDDSGSSENGEPSVMIIGRNNPAGFIIPLQSAAGRIILSFIDPSVSAGISFKLGEEKTPSVSLAAGADGKVLLMISRREHNIIISHDDSVLASLTAEGGQEELQLWLEAVDRTLRLDSILVLKGEDRLAFQPAETGGPS